MKSTIDGFTIVDRRGQNREQEPVAVKETPAPEGKAAVHIWDDVYYELKINSAGNGLLLIVGQAGGLRSDGKTFRGLYLIFPVQTDSSLDWRPHAKKRLDTFLNCECGIAHGTCAVHKLYLPQWIQQDQQRYEQLASQPLPRAAEMLMREEMVKRQSNIVVPR